MQIKSLIVVAAVSGVVAAGCSGSKEKAAVASDSIAQETVTDADIRGQWYIENIVFNDSDYVSGPYTIKGDSITLGAGLMTEMACDNMATEDALRRILPDIATVDVENDTTVRLNGTKPAECILLRKATTEVK